MSAQELITENLDLWTGAVTKKSSSGRGSNGKVELTGVKKLRELILDLAVRGKLVEQNPTDEPASILLSRIKEKKEELVKLGKIKRSRSLPSMTDEEAPSDLPPSWTCARAGDFLHLEMGQSPASKFYNQAQDGLPFFQGKADFGDLYPTVRYWCTHPTKYAEEGDILLSVRAPVGPTNISNISACIGRGLCALRPLAGVPSSIVLYMFRAIRRELEARATGTTFAAVSRKDIETLVLRIPPLAEQHRIVQKVDELISLCDRLEQQTSDQLEAHETLVDTLLGTLTQSENATELADNWARLADHFDTLFTTEQSIDKLKQTILQLAVMGRLVEQDAGAEPAKSLLNRLTENRQAWLHEQSSSNPECKTMLRKLGKLCPAQSPFPLSKGWQPAHLIQLCRMLVDCHNKTAPYIEEGIPIIRTSNIRERRFNFNEMKYVDEDTYTYWSRRCPPEPGDIIFTREAPMGEAAIIPEGKTWCLGQRTMLIRPMHEHISNRFLLLVLTEPQLLERATEKAIGSTVKHLRVGDVENLVVPVPPLDEQHRIVQKVDELMALCDQLRKRLNLASETRSHLAEAVLEGALN